MIDSSDIEAILLELGMFQVSETPKDIDFCSKEASVEMDEAVMGDIPGVIVRAYPDDEGSVMDEG